MNLEKGVNNDTLQGTNISPLKVAGKMIFLFHKHDVKEKNMFLHALGTKMRVDKESKKIVGSISISIA